MDILILLCLISLNSIFAMAEIAVIKTRKVRLQKRIATGERSAQLAVYLSDNPDEFLSTIQIGITSIGILNGIIGEEAFAGTLSQWFIQIGIEVGLAKVLATAVIVIFITYVTIVIGELVPKRLGQIHPESIALFFARPMYILSIVAKPFVWLLAYSTRFILTLFGVKQARSFDITEEELHLLLDEGRGAGIIKQQEHQMVRNVFQMDDRPISSLMVIRKNIIYIDIERSIDENLKIIDQSNHFCFPVCRGGLQGLLGVTHTKKILSQLLKKESLDFTSHLQEPIYVLETLSGLELLKQFQNAKVQMIFVVDEYGEILGIVTLQDLMEAITGQLQIENIEDYWALQREDGSWLFDALIPLFELRNSLQLTSLPEGSLRQYQTLNGMLIAVLERLPQLGDKIEWENWIFEVIDMDGSHADKILVSKKPEQGNAAQD